MTKPKIYVFINGGKGTDFINGCAMAEDGHVLAAHISSSYWWFLHDMGLTSECKHDRYREHYPDGYELVEVEDPLSHEGLMAAYEKNQRLKETE